LSLRRNLGAPRALTRRDNTSMTWAERMRPSASTYRWSENPRAGQPSAVA
jgi:hypothetical protein